MDFVSDSLADRRRMRLLTVVDLGIGAARAWNRTGPSPGSGLPEGWKHYAFRDNPPRSSEWTMGRNSPARPWTAGHMRTRSNWSSS